MAWLGKVIVGSLYWRGHGREERRLDSECQVMCLMEYNSHYRKLFFILNS